MWEEKPFNHAQMMRERQIDRVQTPNDWSIVSSCRRRVIDIITMRDLIKFLGKEAFHSPRHYDGRV